ncbi:hypothetical protein R5W23_005359 [Gemmata sp. JC673]|uniref:DUF4175 domain-containing protein n=1 Tax=Gemmata algarum TaxID=2975278 RepID=A0ABU5FBF4_9BACT|nr:hypothetical protein [Gemmata algarum]MDY3563743.1 hypothetical protein [Gemmata algarum]
MSEGFGDLPKFPGDLSDRLPPRLSEPPDRWSDRLRHAWLVYLLLAILGPMWVAALVLTFVYLGEPLGFLSLTVVMFPVGLYLRVVTWRTLSGRDPDTGKRIGRPEQ